MNENKGPRPIREVAGDLGIRDEHFIPYGRDKGKVDLAARASGGKAGKLILVSALTPTSAGEGKTTTSICLAQGLAHLGQKACLALREPSLGPTFGMKGGATGAGRASLTPSDDVNLHFTGDFHAIGAANNLLAAALDNHLHQGNELGLDPRRVAWRRVMDMNDRALRDLVIGLGGVGNGVPREAGFDITPASEVMASLCLAEDAEDLRLRLSRMIVGFTYDRKPVTAADLKAVGAMMVLLRDALHPNLVQTVEGVPAFIHGGPFANIAHGCNSVIATKMALAHADWVVTEAGFGFDLGGEKFFDVKCRTAGLNPSAVVLVATIRALKRHAEVPQKEIESPNPAAVERGMANLYKHVENAKAFGKVPVVAINRFPSDTEEEIAVVRAACAAVGVPCALSEGVARGGEGAAELAAAVMAHAEATPRPFTPVYEWSEPVQTKLEKIAKNVYGAAGVSYTADALKDVERWTSLGFGGLPLCVVKTHMSLSDDPRRAGRPEGFEVTVRGVLLSAGPGFLIPLLGEVMRMPGLPKVPQLELMDLVDGKIIGLR